MSDMLPAVTGGDLRARAAAGSGVAALRLALGRADTMRGELAEAGDWESLASGLDQLRVLSKDLSVLVRAVEADVHRLLPERKVEVPGFGVIEKRNGAVRKRWRSDELLSEVVSRSLVDPATGEIEDDPRAVRERLVAALVAAVPFTGSLGWRVTALRDMGLDPDEWAEITGYTQSVQIHKAGE